PQPPEGSPPGDLGDRKCGIQGQHCRLMATTASTLCIAHPSAKLPPGRRMTNHSHYESSVLSRPDSAPGAMQLFMADSSPTALDGRDIFVICITTLCRRDDNRLA